MLFLEKNTRADNESALSKLKELKRQEETSPGVFKMDFWPAGFDDAVRVFKTILPEISFEPDYQAVPDGDSKTPNGTIAINTAKDLALAILGASTTKSVNLLNLDDPILAALDLYFKKLTTAIDPNWKWLTVYANVGPPDGTPNATSGMNPDAITDPFLKQGYLDIIKQNQNNNLKNSQQSCLRAARKEFLVNLAHILKRTKMENWTRENAIARFCKDEESKKILEEAIKTGW
jgi:hypothetical protein